MTVSSIGNPIYNRTRPLQNSSKLSGAGSEAGQNQSFSANLAQNGAASTVSPAQFSTSMLLDLLNGTQGVGPYNPTSALPLHLRGLPLHLDQHSPAVVGTNSPSGFTTETVSSDEVGLNVASINGPDAANEIINAAGNNGELTLSDVNKLLGLGGPDDLSVGSPYSPDAAIERDWSMLTGSSKGAISKSELSSLIDKYQKTWDSTGSSGA